jgi:hypothetical protein
MLMNCRKDTFNRMEKLEGKIEVINNAPNMLENVINALKMRTLKCSTSFNKLINLCVNCNCVNFYHNSCHAVIL